MADCVGAAQRLLDGRGVADVAAGELEPGVAGERRDPARVDGWQQHVEDARLVTGVGERLDEVGPDEPGTTGHAWPPRRPALNSAFSSLCNEVNPCCDRSRPHLMHSVTTSSSQEIRIRPPSAVTPAPVSGPWARSAPRAVRHAAGLGGMIAILAYLFVALRRLDYPFALEWLEGNSLAEVHRVLAGQNLYPAPTAGYVPDGYPPLYFAVSAAAARVVGPSYLTLRLVSLISSLACFAVLGRLVQRETASMAAGTAAAGLLAATYSVTDTWFDVARVDSLFLALSIGALYSARHMRGTGGAVTAGVLLAAAALTKQTGLAECAAVIAVLLIGSRRRLGWVAALAEVVVLGVSTLVLALTSGGWYLFYVYRLMSEHPLTGSSFGSFWTALAAALGLAAAAAGARRAPGTAGAAGRAAPRWRSKAMPPWCTAAAASTTCCPVTSRWRCWPAWLSAARRPGGPPRRACSSSPRRRCCSAPCTRPRSSPARPTARSASGWSRASARSAER